MRCTGCSDSTRCCSTNCCSAAQPRTTLTTFAANPRWLGGIPAFSLVLHTWKQDLGRHLHVHALVAGGALTAAGEWVQPRRGFLFPLKALAKVFRGKFIAALEQERRAGQLHQDPALTTSVWHQLLAQLYIHDWVVYAKQPLGGPAQVLEYLSRYTHRVAISNERIVGITHDTVALRVRVCGERSKRRTLRVAGSEFIERFLQHVLPRGFKRIRHYGRLGPAHKAAHLAAARAALKRSSATAEGNRVHQRLHAAGGAHRVVGLPLLPSWPFRRRAGSCPKALSSIVARSTVTPHAVLSAYCRLQSVAPLRHGCVRAQRSALPLIAQSPPRSSTRDRSAMTANLQTPRYFHRSLCATRLTRGPATLQSP